MKRGTLPKLGLLALTCYNSYRRRGFNSNRRQLQGGSRPVNFDNIYESGFLSTLRSFNLNGTFVLVDGGGWLAFIQWLRRHCLGYLSTTSLDRCKFEVPRFQLYFPINPNPVPQPLQPLPLKYEPVISWDYDIHCFPSFLFLNKGNIRMILNYHPVSDPTLVCLRKKAWKISTHNLVHCNLNLHPSGVPLSPSGQMLSWYLLCCVTIYPYQQGR